MGKNKRRRPQTPKANRHANPAYIEAMREIRRSNATVPVPSGKAYNRASERRMRQSQSWE